MSPDGASCGDMHRERRRRTSLTQATRVAKDVVHSDDRCRPTRRSTHALCPTDGFLPAGTLSVGDDLPGKTCSANIALDR